MIPRSVPFVVPLFSSSSPVFSRLSIRRKSTITAATRNGRFLDIEWSNGDKGRFPVVWMRDCSPDPYTYTISPAMTARNLHMSTFDVEVEPLSLSIAENGNELIVEWPGLTSKYQADWLRERNACNEEVKKRRRQWYLFPTTTWGNEMEANVNTVDYTSFMNDDKTLHDSLKALCLDGIVVVKGAERRKRGIVEEIGKRIGLIHNTHFGHVFEVSTKSDASNMAYATKSVLPFHTDFTSLADPPQLQMLHMFIKAQTGGNSLFVDGFHVAEKLRIEHPKIFEILSRLSCEFTEEGFDLHEGKDGKDELFTYNMAARHTTIKTDSTGRVVRVQFGNAMRSWFYDCTPEETEQLYKGLKMFTNYCYDKKNIIKLSLEEGDSVIWANTRVLHTRDSYVDIPSSPRTLTGCYFAWDIVKSRVRQLSRSLQLPSAQPPA